MALQPSPRRVVPSSGPVTGTDSVVPSAERETPLLAFRRPQRAEAWSCESTRYRPPGYPTEFLVSLVPLPRQRGHIGPIKRSVDAIGDANLLADRAPTSAVRSVSRRSASLPAVTSVVGGLLIAEASRVAEVEKGASELSTPCGRFVQRRHRRRGQDWDRNSRRTTTIAAYERRRCGTAGIRGRLAQIAMPVWSAVPRESRRAVRVCPPGHGGGVHA